ncbi:MAG: hypothetical protein EBZ29_00630 [Synechococcaceae bacterium WB9_4xC_028]|uniref:hypothetical protein n=1 Tax=unclassified Synechococcus TaxID=2626047 RepID=UPI001039BE76|nr:MULTISPECIES: hypothetical protein [unclassified Synechococcus]NDD44393.1 hypothetical protein [Synechococcaceae bacterium WB9_4xB_025]NDD67932.1 hypothetical protein [Synechococcaceae bacterium WB9_4xC_028]TCD57459.1 hypothetical protein CWE16_04520 [Synechococcus sp. BS55D]TCD58795.1 hypothetical protein CWE17_06125 [Synechococcus sp. BS56D]
MTSPSDPHQRRQLHPLPRGLVELYGLIAVLVVLIPEWLADGTITLGGRPGGAPLPMRSRAWRAVPELHLASMNLAELRQLARDLRLRGYSGDARQALTNRLLKRIRRRSGAGNAL